MKIFSNIYEMLNNSSFIYYQKKKERLQKRYVKGIKVFLKKKKKQLHGGEQDKNLFKHEKQKLVKHRKIVIKRG